MYEAFFGLRERPFELRSDARFLMLTGPHLEALSTLQYGAAAMRGMTLLIGEAGTGKTTLLRAVFGAGSRVLPAMTCALVDNPALRRHEFFEMLAETFGIGRRAVQSKTRFLGELRASLLRRRNNGENCVVVIDEAQSLPLELLEEVRLLSNLESDCGRLLTFVLAGHPDLATRLNDAALLPLKQRIGLRCLLRRLDANECAAFIAGRVRVAGGEPRRLFSREAILAIHAVSGGVPRTISVTCDNALLTGFALGRPRIDHGIVESVAADLELAVPPPIGGMPLLSTTFRTLTPRPEARGFSSVNAV